MCLAPQGQVLVLNPRTEERLAELLRDRILPAALESLRLWEKGGARCWQPVRMLHSALRWSHASEHAGTRTREKPGVALWPGSCPCYTTQTRIGINVPSRPRAFGGSM